MKEDFIKELETLLQLAYDAGYVQACWNDGASSNEAHEKSEADYKLYLELFLEKHK
jgi:hypothetical protein